MCVKTHIDVDQFKMPILLYINYSPTKYFPDSVGYRGASSEQTQFSGEGGNGDIPTSRAAPRKEG